MTCFDANNLRTLQQVWNPSPSTFASKSEQSDPVKWIKINGLGSRHGVSQAEGVRETSCWAWNLGRRDRLRQEGVDIGIECGDWRLGRMTAGMQLSRQEGRRPHRSMNDGILIEVESPAPAQDMIFQMVPIPIL